MDERRLTDQLLERLKATPTTAGPHPDLAELVAYFRDEVSDEETEAVRQHLSQCPVCAQEALELAEFLDASLVEPEDVRTTVDARTTSPDGWLDQAGAAVRRAKTTVASWLAGPSTRLPAWAFAILLAVVVGLLGGILDARRQAAQLATAKLNVPIITLESARFSRGVRSDDIASVEPGATLVLLPAEDLPDAEYRVDIRGPEDRAIWSGSGLSRNPNGSFHLALPQDLEVAQDIRIRMLSATPSGEVLEEFVARVESQSTPRASFRLTGSTSPERRLEPGVVHRYSFDLEPGQFLRLAVAQRGVDVIVDVIDGKGRRLFQADSPNGSHGDESILLVADIAGPYHLEIRPLDERHGGGIYQVRVETLRAATDDDRLLAGAEQAFALARELRAQHRGELPTDMVEQFLKAVRLWRELGMTSRQAEAFYHLAGAYQDASRPHQAIAFYDKALELQTHDESRRARALTLNNLATIHLDLGDIDLARNRFEEALAIHDAVGHRRGQATTLINLGKLHQQQGRVLPALDHFERALALLREIDAGPMLVSAHNGIGSVYTTMGETRLALGHHRKSREILDPHKDRSLWAATLNLEGNAYLEAGDFSMALTAYEQALEFLPTGPRTRSRAVSLAGIGLVHSRRGEPELARRAYRNALAIFEQREEALEAATVRNSLGWLHNRNGEPAEALELHRRALATARQLDDKIGEATALFGSARAEASLERLAAAIDTMQEALEVVETIRHQTHRSDLRIAYLSSRHDYYDFLIQLLMRQHRVQPDAGWDARAFGVSEQAHARSLLENLAEDHGHRSGVDAEHRSELESLWQAIQDAEDARQSILLGEAPRDDLAAIEAHRRERLAELRRVEGEIRESNPLLAGLGRPTPLALEDIQRHVVDEETLLLEVHLGEPRSYLWAVTPRGLSAFELPSRATIDAQARAAYEWLTTSHHQTRQSRRSPALDQLGRWLLTPVADALGSKRLFFVGSGALHHIPLAALPDPRSPSDAPRPLGEVHDIVVLPSGSVYAALDRERAARDPAPGLLAMVADPVFTAEDPRLTGSHTDGAPAAEDAGLPRFERLPHSAAEAEAILGMAAGETTFRAVGFDANRSLVLGGELTGYQILHFSTHGILNTEFPELSALLLSRFDPQGRRIHGRLQAHEISTLDLPADLVVLGACETALGRGMRGEGLLSLPRSFLYAGASAVLVSLWQVGDQSTADLMERFYRALLIDGLTPSAALQEAQRSMRSDPRWRAPYYWAGFVLQGVSA